MASLATVSFFQAQQDEDANNNMCCDTGSAGPQWASPSHGIFISIEAAGVHRSLGVKVSRVLSTTMDSWKPLQLKMMELGGNKKFAEFLRSQGVPDNMPIRLKYTTRAADWYRKNLLAMAQNSKPPEPMAPGTGHMPSSDADARAGQLLLDEVFCSATPLHTVHTRCVTATQCQTRGSSSSSSSSNSSSSSASSNDAVSSTASTSVSRHSRSPSPKKHRGISMQVQPSPRLNQQQQLQLWWLWTTKGDRVAEKLRRMSTGTMAGFGPGDCLPDPLVTDTAVANLSCVAIA